MQHAAASIDYITTIIHIRFFNDSTVHLPNATKNRILRSFCNVWQNNFETDRKLLYCMKMWRTFLFFLLFAARNWLDVKQYINGNCIFWFEFFTRLHAFIASFLFSLERRMPRNVIRGVIIFNESRTMCTLYYTCHTPKYKLFQNATNGRGEKLLQRNKMRTWILFSQCLFVKRLSSCDVRCY